MKCEVGDGDGVKGLAPLPFRVAACVPRAILGRLGRGTPGLVMSLAVCEEHAALEV